MYGHVYVGGWAGVGVCPAVGAAGGQAGSGSGRLESINFILDIIAQLRYQLLSQVVYPASSVRRILATRTFRVAGLFISSTQT